MARKKRMTCIDNDLFLRILNRPAKDAVEKISPYRAKLRAITKLVVQLGEKKREFGTG